MPKGAIQITLTKEEKNLLVENTKPNMQYRFVQRAKIILLAEQGYSNEDISIRVGLSFVSVSIWRNRYAKYGIVGLKDKAGRGRPKKLTHNQILKVVEVACKKPKDATHWSIRRLADELKFVKKSRLQEILKGFDLKPHQSKMWCFSNDPKYEEKKADIIGLYLNPPKNAFVVGVDEKTGIQALSRKRVQMKSGNAELYDHQYKRNGTVDLFAAFRINDGKVIGSVEKKHRAIEFLRFIKIVYNKWGRNKKIKLHIVIDNFSTHEVDEVKKWLKKHKNVIFHFTPTHASWLNQIELWFSILQRQLIKRGDFKSVRDLDRKIINFIKKYNKKAKPFAWCYGEPLKI
jgi:transposase